jgi:hypothetical protein
MTRVKGSEQGSVSFSGLLHAYSSYGTEERKKCFKVKKRRRFFREKKKSRRTRRTRSGKGGRNP